MQTLLPLEPTEAELQAQMRQFWQGRAFWRQRFASLEALLADPGRQRLFRLCARQALRARVRAKASAQALGH